MVVPTRLAIRTRAGELTCALFEEEGVGDTGDIASDIVIPIRIAVCLGRQAGLNAILSRRKRQRRKKATKSPVFSLAFRFSSIPPLRAFGPAIVTAAAEGAGGC